jgi:predicted acylesterase/phospholipase RssA
MMAQTCTSTCGARESDRPLAFVLSGGASHGAIGVGMLRALYERGIARI